jgi:peptidoglycan/LPS O-acetylase OafA/YrhL
MFDWLRKYGRITNSTEFIPQIDGLRFFSIITVMIFHLNSTLSSNWGLARIEDSYELLGGGETMFDFGWWLRRLDLGVKVFFAISGFVLALPLIKRYLARDPFISLSKYYRRRLLRIEPPFLVSLLVFSLVYIFHKAPALSDVIPTFLSTLGYSHVLIFGYPSPINPVTWSLETEAQFYLLFPYLFLFIFAYRNNAWLTMSFLLLMVATLYIRGLFFFENNEHFNLSVLFYISHFCAGILFAWLYLRYKFLFWRKRFVWDITTLIAVVGLFYFYKPQDRVLNNFMFNLSMMALFFGVFKGFVTSRICSEPIVFVIGGMCYSLYLLHLGAYHLFTPFILPYLHSLGYSWSLFTMSLTVLPITLFVGTLFYLAIERPTMDEKWFRKLKFYLRKKQKKQIESN